MHWKQNPSNRLHRIYGWQKEEDTGATAWLFVSSRKIESPHPQYLAGLYVYPQPVALSDVTRNKGYRFHDLELMDYSETDDHALEWASELVRSPMEVLGALLA